GNVGGAWGSANASSQFSCPPPPVGRACGYDLPANLAAVGAAGSGSLRNSAFTGGVQAGFNWQAGAVVFGIETDFNSFRLSNSQTVTTPLPAAITSVTVNESLTSNWLYTLRGRLGWSMTPTALLYATGGLAVTRANLSNAFTDNLAVVGGVGSVNVTGASTI